MKPLRILHILADPDTDNASAERAVYLLVKEQIKDAALAPSIWLGKSNSFHSHLFQGLGCPVTIGDFDSNSWTALIQALRGFDVHHLHTDNLNVLFASLLVPGVKRVFTYRNPLIPPTFWEKMRFAVAGLLLGVGFHALTSSTLYGASMAAQHYHLPARWFATIYNGVEFELLVPKRPSGDLYDQLHLDQDCVVIGTATHFKAWKRLHLLLEAVAKLQVLPHLRLLLVGDGPELDNLRQRAAQLNIQSRVLFAGKQSHVADFLQVMDIFCLPSEGLEPFGNAVVEAMAFGLPTVIFADGGGKVEHIVDGVTGYIVADLPQLIYTLHNLIQDAALRAGIGQAGQTAVREKYPVSRSAQAFKTLYFS